MTYKEASDLMTKEYDCLARQLDSACSFDCENCDLVRTIPDVMEAQKIALRLLDIEVERVEKFRNFPSGGEST